MRPNGDKKRRKSPERRRTSSLSKTSATSSAKNGVNPTTASVSVGTETGPPSQRNSFYDAREYTPPLTVAPLASAGMLVSMIYLRGGTFCHTARPFDGKKGVRTFMVLGGGNILVVIYCRLKYIHK